MTKNLQRDVVYSFEKEALRRFTREEIMTKKPQEEFCTQYDAKKLCQEASGRLFTRSITPITA
jgi:hypothetical protein